MEFTFALINFPGKGLYFTTLNVPVFPMLKFLRRKRIRRLSSKVPEGEMRVLHISDTPESVYGFIEELIDELNPEVIIHTGDLADNIKLERRPELKPLYTGALRKLARILKRSGAKLYIVPGNEDDPGLVREFFGDAVVEPGTVVEIGGKKFVLGHRPEEVEGINADFKLHGHNFRKIPRGLNGVIGANLILLPSGRVHMIGYPAGTDTDRGYKLWRGM